MRRGSGQGEALAEGRVPATGGRGGGGGVELAALTAMPTMLAQRLDGAPLIVRVRDFRPDDQQLVRDLLLAGLADYWGSIDEGLNPDLDNIGRTYATGRTIVADMNAESSEPER